jgi:hypothetical protein
VDFCHEGETIAEIFGDRPTALEPGGSGEFTVEIRPGFVQW